MTNLLAAVIVTIATNWTSTGTFTPKIAPDGNHFFPYTEDVQQARVITNTTVILDWEGARHEIVLKSVPGPVVGERRVPSVATNYTYWATNIIIPNKGWYTITNVGIIETKQL
jgi:hypothetical protein